MIDYNFVNLESIGELPQPLNDEELYKNIKLINLGNKKAYDIVFIHNLRLVIKIVMKFNNSLYNLDDLFQIGTIGLMKAINNYNLGKKIKFSTYATCCIQNEILMALRKIKHDKKNISLNEPITNNNKYDGLSFENILTDINFDILDNYLKEEENKFIRDFIKDLPNREKDMLMLFFGFYDNKCYTQKEIAKRYNISQSAVSKTIKRSLIKLKNEIINNYNDNLLTKKVIIKN